MREGPTSASGADPSGPRVTLSGNRTQKVLQGRKHGPGGEGPDHRNLKEWIAKHPEAIGLPVGSKAEVEYCFTSCDQVDALFELPDGRYAAVEIETTDPLPGAHQALKYRVLTCAAKGLPRDSDEVIAILVAWEMPESVQHFCRQYDIQWVAMKL